MDLCNESHDVLMMANDLKSIAVLNIHGFEYRYIVHQVSQTKFMNLFKNSDLKQKFEHCKIWAFYCIYKKWINYNI